jgi:hypothetical protein
MHGVTYRPRKKHNGAFEKLTTRISNSAGGWSEKMLSSAAGRKVLIKAVMQAIPTYSMNCFSSSKTTCNRLNTSVGNFGGKEMWINRKCTREDGKK